MMSLPLDFGIVWLKYNIQKQYVTERYRISIVRLKLWEMHVLLDSLAKAKY